MREVPCIDIKQCELLELLLTELLWCLGGMIEEEAPLRPLIRSVISDSALPVPIRFRGAVENNEAFGVFAILSSTTGAQYSPAGWSSLPMDQGMCSTLMTLVGPDAQTLLEGRLASAPMAPGLS